MTTSPYLVAAARRASVQMKTLVMVGSQAPYRRSDYQFPRVQTDPTPLERTGPAFEPLWHSWLAGALTLFAIAVVVVLT